MVRLLLSLIFCFVVVFFCSLANQYADAASAAFDLSPFEYIKPLLYFLLTAVGALAAERYKYFSNSPDAGKNFFENLSYPYIYRSLVVSPIVFGVTITFIGRDANFLMSAIFSFQNGFFWESVFEGVKKLVANRKQNTKIM